MKSSSWYEELFPQKRRVSVATMQLVVLSSEREIYQGVAKEVCVPGREGALSILPHHEALFTALKEGEMRMKLPEREEYFHIYGGFLTVSHNTVTALVDVVERSEELDHSRAEEARHLAQASMIAMQDERATDRISWERQVTFSIHFSRKSW